MNSGGPAQILQAKAYEITAVSQTKRNKVEKFREIGKRKQK